jgi:cytokinin riboside 5'-monophosphate phosphoribohydrolase
VELAGAELLDEVGSQGSLLAQGSQTKGIVSFGESLPLLIRNEWAVIQAGCGRIECPPQQNLAEGRFNQIRAANDLGDGQISVVDGGGELVARQVILPPDEEVAEVSTRHGGLLTERLVDEIDRFAVGHPEAPVLADGPDQRRQGGVGGGSPFAGIERLVGFPTVRTFMRGARGRGDIAARPGARIDHALVMQALQCLPIQREAFTLRNHWFGPVQAEPTQIVSHRLDVLGAAARAVEVVISEEERAAGMACAFSRDPEGAGMSEVEETGGRRRQPSPIRCRKGSHGDGSKLGLRSGGVNPLIGLDPMSRLLCVYCSSSRTLAPKYYAAGEAVGKALAAQGWGLIYGGGNAGTMGAVARATQEAGGHVVGVIPHFMRERELAFAAADELVFVDSMRERKRIMAERAAAFLTLPGGIGTLEELSEILVERSLDLSRKPLVLLNQDGFYDDLLRFFQRMVSEGFKSGGLTKLFGVASSVEDVWPLLENPQEFVPDALWRSSP